MAMKLQIAAGIAPTNAKVISVSPCVLSMMSNPVANPTMSAVVTPLEIIKVVDDGEAE